MPAVVYLKIRGGRTEIGYYGDKEICQSLQKGYRVFYKIELKHMDIKDIWNFLGLTQDRIGRRRFLIAFFSVQWGLPLAVILLMGLFYLVFGEDNPILFLPAIVFFASLVFGLIVYIKICIRRVRDIGIAQSWWVLAIIPLINIPFFLYLVLNKGKAISNDHTANTSKTEGDLFS